MALQDKILQVITGEHVAAIATIADGHPAVRFMALMGFNYPSLIGATMKNSRKVLH
jgi:general stress protein 26